jgi:hypothetical protein
MLTAEGRKKARDYQLEGVHRTLRKDGTLTKLSLYQRGTLAELKLIGQELYADIKRRGVILPDGEVNPAVEAHRKNAHEQLYSLSVYTEVNHVHASEHTDIVALMADKAETVEPEPPSEGAKSATDT